MTKAIKLPPNPWVSVGDDAQTAACVVPGGPDGPEGGRQALDRPFAEGPGRRREILEQQFISKYCNPCPIRTFCAEYGKDELYGIWGGRTESQRRNDREFLAFLKAF